MNKITDPTNRRDMLLVAFLSSHLILGVKNEKVDIRGPKFTSKVIDLNGTLPYDVYEFTCTMYTLPTGGLLHFYVNQRSTDTMRFYNNSCFNKYSKCTDEMCSCSFLDFTFTWRHKASKSDTLKTFAVEMKFSVNNLGKVITSLRRTYNKTALMDSNYDWHTMENSAVDIDTKGTMFTWVDFTLICISCFCIGCVIGMLFSTFWIKVKRRYLSGRGGVKKAVDKDKNVRQKVHENLILKETVSESECRSEQFDVIKHELYEQWDKDVEPHGTEESTEPYQPEVGDCCTSEHINDGVNTGKENISFEGTILVQGLKYNIGLKFY